MAVTGFESNGALQRHLPLEAQLQATLNVIPAYTWYATPSGGLTFVNKRCADYLGLAKEHPCGLVSRRTQSGDLPEFLYHGE